MKRKYPESCLDQLIAFTRASVLLAACTTLYSTRHIAAAEDSAKGAATVEEAAKVLDLRKWPLPDGATVENTQQVAQLIYSVKGSLKASFEREQKQLLKAGWKELPGTQVADQYCTGNFQKSGFVLTVTSYDAGEPTKSGMSRIALMNLGNVSTKKLPVIKGTKSVYLGDTVANYSSSQKVPDVVAASRKLLLESGWEFYGSNPNPPDSEVLTFKRNAIRLTAYVGSAPADNGQTSIAYSVAMMSADIPAPATAEQVDFADDTKTLRFETTDDYDAVGKFYHQRLAKMGWKPTLPDITKQNDQYDRPTAIQVFRNDAKDLLTLDLQPADENKSRAKLSHFTSAEYDAMVERQKAAAKKLIADREKREKESAAELARAKKAAQKKIKAEIEDGFPDVDSLIKGAVGDAIKDGDVDIEKLLKGKIPGAGGAKAGAGSAKESVTIPIPDGAKKVTQTTDNVLQMKLPAGKGQAAAKLIRDELLAANWKIDGDDKITAQSGNLSFSKGKQKLTLTYVDPGVADVTLMLIGIGTKLEQGKGDTAKPK